MSYSLEPSRMELPSMEELTEVARTHYKLGASLKHHLVTSRDVAQWLHLEADRANKAPTRAASDAIKDSLAERLEARLQEEARHMRRTYRRLALLAWRDLTRDVRDLEGLWDERMSFDTWHTLEHLRNAVAFREAAKNYV
jgi:hypothetical protein